MKIISIEYDDSIDTSSIVKGMDVTIGAVTGGKVIAVSDVLDKADVVLKETFDAHTHPLEYDETTRVFSTLPPVVEV